MATLRHRLFRGLVTGAHWSIILGAIAFVILPVYLLVARPWEHVVNLPTLLRILGGHGSPGAPSRAELLQAAAGFALLFSAVGFLGGFLAGMQRTTVEDGK